MPDQDDAPPSPDHAAAPGVGPPIDLHVDSSSGRDEAPVGDEHKPSLSFPVVGIGASAGGLEAFTEFFEAMPPDKGMAFVLVQHLSPKRESLIAEILQKHTRMPVLQVADGMLIEPDHVYVIRPGFTLTMKGGQFQLGESLLKTGHSRPVDDFFRSLAAEQRERAVAIIMSGMGSNGTSGTQAIKVVGGVTIAQDPDSAKYPSMPRSCIDTNLADFILKPAEMPAVLIRVAGHTYVDGNASAEVIARRESQHINEVLAILRARVRHDFTGYKKPTIVRRIQRRMSLTQNASMSDYARMLRQTPAEVLNLSDDLMIHVTGFFRDGEVWEALKEKVIVPLVAERAEQASIRVWVTACASGEEAYTLAMLLVEAAEQADKRFDIKVFATDMAERALSHARAGVFAGGIESEISPDRMARFFDKEDSMYRVKKDLRELVVFAPQNVLQDPPFSRLDLITCRNLLIYLEPEVQQRVLSLLHFGLREGGTLMLGNSETIGDREGMFEPIDKKFRIYRRIGPTRHGLVDFPPAHAAYRASMADPPDGGEPRQISRASLTQITHKVLLDHYTPASVVVDRHGRIVHFHGPTELFLDQPRGEPTRELLLLAREFVRGPIRVGLHRAVEINESVTIKDGSMPTDAGLHRVEVTVEPLEQRGIGTYYLVSFIHYPLTVIPVDRDVAPDMASALELESIRDELRSTVEELQTSNEELKASNEEVTSINEELQSTNEELETSKEELQSLNEELTTVNSQLQAKMEELQATGSDLASLLSSTDIAVIFLDPQLRIRRYTPAVKRLIDLIPTDVGRPLADMARRFEDARLIDDARAVLEALVPIATEVYSEDRHWFTRRVLPYRTAENRIDGVVITFIDITERKNADTAMRISEDRMRRLVQVGSEAMYRMSADWRHMLYLEGNNFLPDTATANQSWLERYIPDEDRDLMNHRIQQAITRKVEFQLEHRVRRADGSIGWTFSRALPILDAAGEIIEWYGVASDITDRKQAEHKIRLSEERLQRMNNVKGVGVLTFERSTGRLLDCNDAFLHMSGYTVAEVASGRLTWISLAPPEFASSGLDLLIADGDIGPFERQCVFKDGSRRWMLFAGARVADNAIVEYCIDISDRKDAETQLHNSESQFRAVADLVPDLLWQSDAKGNTHWYNRRWLEYTGQTLEQATARGWLETIHPDDRDASSVAWRSGLLSRQDVRQEHRISRHDGVYRWFLVQAKPLIGENGDVLSWFGAATDIHEQRIALDALRASEARFRAVANVVPQMLCQLDATGKTLWLNQLWINFTGQTLAEAQADSWLATVHPEDRADASTTFDHSIGTGEPWRHELRMRHAADRTYRWFLIQALPQRGEHGIITSWFGSVTDIHEQRTVLNELHSSKNQLISLVESAREFAIFMLDETGLITHWNAGASSLLGWAESEAIGRSVAMIFTAEDREKGAPQLEMRTALRDGRAPDERWHQRKDGSQFWSSGVMSPVRDEFGHHRGFVKILRDTTEQRRTELRRTDLLEREHEARSQLEGANRIKDDFLATLSHELRTPLASILIWSKLLRTEAVGTPEYAEGIDAIERSAESQRQLIDDLLDSSRITLGKLRLERREIELTPLMQQAVDAIAPMPESKNVTVNTEFAQDVGIARADADRLRQIVWNLLTNAVKFTPSGGRVTVGLQRLGEQVRMSVSDTGRGIEPSFLPHVFERFTQADPAMTRTQGGLGLGLSIVHKLVELHGGTITAESNGTGQGATFTVDLPLPLVRSSLSKPPRADGGGSASVVSLEGIRILLVEDQAGANKAITKLLKNAGADVVAVKTAAEALGEFAQQKFSLLLSDIGLPGMDGLQMIRQIRASEIDLQGKKLPAIALTAYARENDQIAAKEAGFDMFVTKPFDPDMLIGLIAEITRQRPAKARKPK